MFEEDDMNCQGHDEETQTRIEMVGTPQKIAHFYVYRRHYIDFLDCMQDAVNFLAKDGRAYLKIAAAHKRFLEAGWEGDGTIQIGWIPSFFYPTGYDFGICFWHVKQRNNGTSWIACEHIIEGTDVEQVLPK